MAFAPITTDTTRDASSDDVLARPRIARTLCDGLVAGQTAGLVMAAAMMALYTFALGRLPFLPLQTIGAIVHGDSALEGMNAAAFFTGVAIHQLGPALAWGFVFGVLVLALRPQRASGLMFLGLAVGVLAQLVDVDILLPRVSSELHVANYWSGHVHPIVSWLVHLAFGLSLSFYPWKYDPARRRFA